LSASGGVALSAGVGSDRVRGQRRVSARPSPRFASHDRIKSVREFTCVMGWTALGSGCFGEGPPLDRNHGCLARPDGRKDRGTGSKGVERALRACFVRRSRRGGSRMVAMKSWWLSACIRSRVLQFLANSGWSAGGLQPRAVNPAPFEPVPLSRLFEPVPLSTLGAHCEPVPLFTLGAYCAGGLLRAWHSVHSGGGDYEPVTLSAVGTESR
jgi:hypothetical protein